MQILLIIITPSLVPGVLAAVLHVQHLGRAQHQVRAQHRSWQLSLPGEHVKSFDETQSTQSVSSTLATQIVYERVLEDPKDLRSDLTCVY